MYKPSLDLPFSWSGERHSRSAPMKTLILFFLVLAIIPSAFAQSATVNWNTTHQTIDGFMGATIGSSNQTDITGKNSSLFFSPTSGIGLSYIRTGNSADGSIPDRASLQAAVANGAKVFLTMSSPPASLKQSGSFAVGTASSNGTCLRSDQSLATSYSAYAAYIVDLINTYQDSHNNIPIELVSVQNEPDVTTGENSNVTVGSCIFTSQAFHDFVEVLGPALSAAGLTTKILLPELSEWFDQDKASTCLTDSSCSRYVTYVGGHGYEFSGGNLKTDGTGAQPCCHTASPFAPAVTAGKHLWMTEVDGGLISNGSGGFKFDPSITDAMVWAHNIHDYLTVAGVSAWGYWQLTAYSGSDDNFGLTDQNFNPAKRFYAEGNWSKFVRPGWVRIDATANPQSGVFVSAFKEVSSGKFAIVVVNRNSSAVTLDFSLSGFPTVTSVVPTITSANDNLADQASENVSSGEFSYSLPATSVTTFHAVASTTVSTKPSAPHNLVVVVK